MLKVPFSITFVASPEGVGEVEVAEVDVVVEVAEVDVAEVDVVGFVVASVEDILL